MSNRDFTATILVDQSPSEVFQAINNVRGWWSEEIGGRTDKLHSEWTYHYRDVHLCTLKVSELVPDKRIAWIVLDNYFNFTKDEAEWKDTTITFDISRKGNKTEVRFTHLGLIPDYECYDICSNAWGSYINGSLRSLITTVKGQPNRKE